MLYIALRVSNPDQVGVQWPTGLCLCRIDSCKAADLGPNLEVSSSSGPVVKSIQAVATVYFLGDVSKRHKKEPACLWSRGDRRDHT